MDVTVYLLTAPGYGAEDLWYPEATEALSYRGFAVVPVPAPEPASLESWVRALAGAFTAQGPITVVAHDLGAPVVLEWLQQGGRADYTVLVGPAHPGAAVAGGFFDRWPPDWEKVREQGLEPAVLWSDDDPVTPREAVEVYREGMGAELTVFQGKGHFMGTTFPEIEYYVK